MSRSEILIIPAMTIDHQSLYVGAAIGFASSFAMAAIQFIWTRSENEKRRKHEIHLQKMKEEHERNMQVRTENIKKTGIPSMREIGGG